MDNIFFNHLINNSCHIKVIINNNIFFCRLLYNNIASVYNININIHTRMVLNAL